MKENILLTKKDYQSYIHLGIHIIWIYLLNHSFITIVFSYSF